MTEPATIHVVPRPTRTPHLCLLAVAVAAAAPSCTAGPIDGTAVAIKDPAGIIDEANAIRALVFPVETDEGTEYSCDADTGRVTPAPPEDFDADIPDAVAEAALEVGGAEARGEVQVPPGDHVVLVQTRGDDPLSGRTNVVTGTGCGTATSESGETRTVEITMQPVLVEGECGDGVLSPDEQCDDGGTMDGDGCTADCRTEPMVVSVRAGGDTSATDEAPAVGWAPGERMAIAYESNDGATDVRFRLLDESGQPIDSPSALAVDRQVDAIPSEQLTPAAAAGNGRAAFAFADHRSGAVEGGDVLFRFVDTASGQPDPSGTDVSIRATMSSTGEQVDPAVATRSDGATLVAFSNAESSTGLSGRRIPGGTSSPDGTSAFELGQGTTDAQAPALATTGSGFVLAFSAGGDVYMQRIDAMGMPVDDPAAPVVDGAAAMGTQDQPTVAFVPEAGGDAAAIVVAWREGGPNGDGDGTAIRARIFGADGSPAGDPFVANTTTGGNQQAPSAAGGSGEIGGSTLGRFVVAWQHAGGIRARLFELDGAAAGNREPMPDTDDFELVGSGTSPQLAVGGPAADEAKWVAVWTQGGDVHRRLFPLP